MGDGISAITLLVEDVPAAKFYSAAFGLPVEAATSRTMRRSGVAVLSLTAMASGRELARPPTHA